MNLVGAIMEACRRALGAQNEAKQLRFARDYLAMLQASYPSHVWVIQTDYDNLQATCRECFVTSTCGTVSLPCEGRRYQVYRTPGGETVFGDPNV